MTEKEKEKELARADATDSPDDFVPRPSSVAKSASASDAQVSNGGRVNGYEIVERPLGKSKTSKHSALWAALKEATEQGKAVQADPMGSANVIAQRAMAHKAPRYGFAFHQAKQSDGTYVMWLTPKANGHGV